MLEDILAIPDHLRDALWRVDSARIAGADSAGMLVCGVGGSAIGGDLAAGLYGARLQRPLVTVRGYRLPSWVTSEWTVLCSSYSGETEETLACFEAAAELGARRVVASTGGSLVDSARADGVPVIGLPGLLTAPRAGVAYMLVCAAQVAALSGIGPSLGKEIAAAGEFLADRVDDLRAEAERVADAVGSVGTVVYGAGLTAPVARRWKSQINENAKLPAFFSELPEADHNEICGWADSIGNGGPAAAVLLEDVDQHPRERLRLRLTAEAIEAAGAAAVRIETVGETAAERLLWAVMLGDLVSVEIAAARGVEALPIAAIDELKRSLAAG